MTGLSSNAGTLAVQLGSKIATGGAFTNNGLIEVDNDIFGTGDAGGSGLTFGGALTNNGDLDIGNSGLTTATTVTAAALSNAAMGTVNLTGGTAQATLDIAGATPPTLTGFYYLQGDALLEFGSGHITAIAANSELSIGGPGARVALSTAATSNSALTALASNSGILDLDDTSLTTTTAFTNHNQVSVGWRHAEPRRGADQHRQFFDRRQQPDHRRGADQQRGFVDRRRQPDHPRGADQQRQWQCTDRWRQFGHPSHRERVSAIPGRSI